MSTPEEVATRVRMVISNSGMMQGEFAHRVGLDPTKLSKSLSGKRRFTSLELAIIADTAGRTVDWLVNGTEAEAKMAARRQDGASTEEPAEFARAYDRIARLLELSDRFRPQRIATLRSSTRSAVAAGTEAARKVPEREVGETWNVESLAQWIEQHCSVDVAIRPLGDGIDGFAWNRDDFHIALINNRKHWVRQRFTMAHELGHFLFADSQGLHVDSNIYRSGGDNSEMRANAFAAAFLMPEPEVRRFFRSDSEIGKRKFSEFIGEFGVSVQAAAYRLLNLGLIDAAGRDVLSNIPFKEAANAGGWGDRYQEALAVQGRWRAPGRLTATASEALFHGEIGVRSIAWLLDSPVEALLSDEGDPLDLADLRGGC